LDGADVNDFVMDRVQVSGFKSDGRWILRFFNEEQPATGELKSASNRTQEGH
jgi:hypothetical protein